MLRSIKITSSQDSEKLVAIFFILVCSLFVLFPDVSFAGTSDSELQPAYQKILDIAQGNGGKILAIASFLLSGISAVRGNLLAFGSSFGVGTILGLGPTMITSGLTALI